MEFKKVVQTLSLPDYFTQFMLQITEFLCNIRIKQEQPNRFKKILKDFIKKNVENQEKEVNYFSSFLCDFIRLEN